MFTQEEVSYRMYKQSAFLVDDPGSASGKLIPADASFNVGPKDNKVENDQVQADGIKREFAIGNRTAMANGGGLLYNLNFLGNLLQDASSGSLASTAFGGIYSTSISNGGSGHVVGTTTITLSGGVGSGGVLLPIIVGGVIVGIVVKDPGSYTTAPTLGTTGPGTGFVGTAALDNTAYGHLGVPAPGAVLYRILEKGAGSALWRRYFNSVMTKLGFDEKTEGLCKCSAEWTSSGWRKKSSTPLDGAPAEVTGTPAEYGSLVLVEGSSVGAVIRSMTTNIEFSVKEKRPPVGVGGRAIEMRRGGITVTGDIEVYFEDEAIANKAEAGTLTSLFSYVTSPDGSFTKLLPEVKLSPDGDWSRSDDGVMYKGGYESIKRTSSVAPIQFRLINHTASY
jgi:hypothetical protein